MTPDKVLETIDIYRKLLGDMEIEAIDYPHDETLEDQELGLAHCYGMLIKMEEFVRAGRMDKAFRWLGFIQGVLWSTGNTSLDVLKRHNRS